jgi:alpha-beta hydrolase superfamily lysophospholipase
MSVEAALVIARDVRLRERARWIRSGDDWCVAHWHAAHGPIVPRVALLCPSIGSERMRGERGFRVLADRLAARGVSTLRLDYPATGNSTGDAIGGREAAPDLVERWCMSIADAAEHARHIVPDAEVVLVGRRLGALLVLKASRSMSGIVKRCVLWDPPPSGRSFVRELRLRESARFDHRYADELAREHPGIGLQWEGHRFDRRTVDAIERLTLNDSGSTAELVDVVANDPDRAVASLRQASGSGSVSVTGHRVADAAFDWSVYDGPSLPEECLAVIERRVTEDAPAPIDDDLPVNCHPALTEVRHGYDRGIREELVRFGPGESMFGVRTSRIAGGAPMTAALILPTGIEPSSGYGDMWARFARRAAEQGVTTLRMDWRGNGESLPYADGAENVSYGARRTEDVAQGIAWLRARFPGASIAVVGLCSGGYYAVHAAAAGVDADRIIAINPQLYWHEGMPPTLDLDDLAPAVEMQLADGLERAMSDGRKWRRLLRGGYHWRDVLRAARGAAARRGWLPSRATPDEDGLLGGRLPRVDLERLFPGPARTHLVYSDDDFGLPHLRAHGRAAYSALMARPYMRLHLLERCDHNYSRESMRARLEPLLLELLGER